MGEQEGTNNSLDHLRAVVELREVVYFEVSARRRDGFADLGPAPDKPSFTMQVLQRPEGARLDIRCVAKLDAPDGLYTVDAAGKFEIKDDTALSAEVSRQFAEKIAIPVLFPYIRVQLDQLSGTVRLKRPSLNLVRLDGVKLQMGSLPA
jgi:hypothetical protein